MKKKAEIETVAKIILWVVFILIALVGIYFLAKFLTA